MIAMSYSSNTTQTAGLCRFVQVWVSGFSAGLGLGGFRVQDSGLGVE